MTVTVLLPGTTPGKVQRVPAATLEAARATVANALRGRGQTLRLLRQSPTEEIYTVPNGRHASIEIDSNP